jgi:hypothetical protein
MVCNIHFRHFCRYDIKLDKKKATILHSYEALNLNCIFVFSLYLQPVTIAERSKACTVFARSEAGIVGSNPT